MGRELFKEHLKPCIARSRPHKRRSTRLTCHKTAVKREQINHEMNRQQDRKRPKFLREMVWGPRKRIHRRVTGGKKTLSTRKEQKEDRAVEREKSDRVRPKYLRQPKKRKKALGPKALERKTAVRNKSAPRSGKTPTSHVGTVEHTEA